MQITGAVLETIGAQRPYADSRPIRVAELELGEPGPTEVLVRMEAAGVCHSDLSVVDGNRVRPVPMLLGHEAAGIVEACGARVSDLAVGERVVMTFLPRCGACPGCATDGRLPCQPGTAANNAGTLLHGSRLLSDRDGAPVQHHLGVSGFATHAVVDRASVVPVAADVPAEVAAVLGCAVLTGGGAVRNAARPEPGARLMVIGLGGVGMAAVLTAVAEGIEVIAVDPIAEKLEQARRLGAAEAYQPGEVADRQLRADHVVECAGAARAFELAVAATAPGGRTVTVGLPSPQARAEISPLQLTAEARTLIGSYLGSAVPARDIPHYVELWRAGKLPVQELISSRIALTQINEAMDQLADGHAVRQVIRFDR